MIGRPVCMAIEITAFERPGRLASSTYLSTMDIQGTLTFDPIREGTRMRWLWELAPRGVLTLMSRIVVWLGHREEEMIWANLKRFLEVQEGCPLQP